MSGASGGAYFLAVDIGGTFTDIVVVGSDGRLYTDKVLSTFDDLLNGISAGLSDVLRANSLDPTGVVKLVHASTVATNAVLEQRGAPTALIATRGFRDVLEIGRLRRPVLYDIFWSKPPPLVRRSLRLEVTERIRADGSVETPLTTADVADVIARLSRSGIHSVAVSLLHSYVNPAHERAIGAALREALPAVSVSLSNEVLPEIREYERTSTTVINAYIQPAIAAYLDRFAEVRSAAGVTAPLLMMQSNGGVTPEARARLRPVTIVESGPAAGALATALMASDVGIRNAIAFDMGGTTAKATVVQDGSPEMTFEFEVGAGLNAASPLLRGGGYALRGPTIAIAEVGSGGGSIAAVDGGGAIQVGPESAAADPGPACYGLGGTLPTVTDANVALGYLNPRTIAGKRIRIDRAKATEAIERHIRASVGGELADCAYGIHLIANENMARAVRAVTVERGRDPRQFDLVAFGGAGPVHAAGLARSIGIRRVVVPVAAGLFSALGLLFADIRHDAVATLKRRLDGVGVDELRARFAEVAATAQTETARLSDVPRSELKTRYVADVHYVGQSADLGVELADLDGDLTELIGSRFGEAYERAYGRRGSGPIEIVSIRASVFAPVRRTKYRTLAAAVLRSARRARAERRELYFGTELGFRTAEIHAGRGALADGAIDGPTVIEEPDTTILVPPGCTARLDEAANVVIEVGGSPRG